MSVIASTAKADKQRKEDNQKADSWTDGQLDSFNLSYQNFRPNNY